MIALLAYVLAIAACSSALVVARRTRARRVSGAARHTPDTRRDPEKPAEHAPVDGVRHGSLAGSPDLGQEPSIVAGVRPDGGGTTIEVDAPATGWRPEVLELIAAYGSAADPPPPSRVWQWGDRPVQIRPVAAGIRIEASGDAYLVITRSHAVLILQAQAVDLWGSARAWGEHWGPRSHALLFGCDVGLEGMAAAGWRMTSLHLAMELANVGQWPIAWMHERQAWSGRGAREPSIRANGAGDLGMLEIGDPTRSPTFARVYDKTAEQAVRRSKTGAETVRTRWRAAGWQPEHGPVYRVEGGLRGKALRLAGLDLTDPAVALSERAHVQAWAYLFGYLERPSSGLIRLLDPTDTARPKDRRVHPIWRAVRQGAARAAVLSLVQIRDATEAEDDARRRRAAASVRRGLATLAVADGHTHPRAAADHAQHTTHAITNDDEWPIEVDVAAVHYADLHEARKRTRTQEDKAKP